MGVPGCRRTWRRKLVVVVAAWSACLIVVAFVSAQQHPTTPRHRPTGGPDHFTNRRKSGSSTTRRRRRTTRIAAESSSATTNSTSWPTNTQDVKIQGAPDLADDPATMARVLQMELVLHSFAPNGRPAAAACDIVRYQVVEQVQAENYFVLELEYRCVFASSTEKTSWESHINNNLEALAEALGVLEVSSLMMTSSSSNDGGEQQQVLLIETALLQQSFALVQGTSSEVLFSTHELVLMGDGLALFATINVPAVLETKCHVTSQSQNAGGDTTALVLVVDFYCSFTVPQSQLQQQQEQNEDYDTAKQLVEQVNDSLSFLTTMWREVGLTSIELALEMIYVGNGEADSGLDNPLAPTTETHDSLNCTQQYSGTSCFEKVGYYQQRFTLQENPTGGNLPLESQQTSQMLSIYEGYTNIKKLVETKCTLKQQSVLRDEMAIASFLFIRFTCMYTSSNETYILDMPTALADYINEDLHRTRMDLQHAGLSIAEAHSVFWLNAPRAAPPVETSGAAFQQRLQVPSGTSTSARLTAADQYNFVRLLQRYADRIVTSEAVGNVHTYCTFTNQSVAVDTETRSVLTVDYQCEFHMYSEPPDPMDFQSLFVEKINSNLDKVRADLNDLVGVPIALVFPVVHEALWTRPEPNSFEMKFSAAPFLFKSLLSRVMVIGAVTLFQHWW